MKEYIERNSAQIIGELRIKYNLYQNIPDLEDLISSFCKLHKIDAVFTKSRRGDIVSWRYAFMMILLMNGYTQKVVGFYFERDHSTVIHAMKVFNNELNGYGNEISKKIKQFIIFAATYMLEKEVSLKETKEKAFNFAMEKIRDKFDKENLNLRMSEDDSIIHSDEESLSLKEILQETLEYYEQLKIGIDAI